MVHTRYRFPRRETTWLWAGMIALGLAFLCMMTPLIVELIALASGTLLSPAQPVLVLALGWALAAGTSIALRGWLPRFATRTLSLDLTRRVLDDGLPRDLSAAFSVEVQLGLLSPRARVLVRDASGAILWSIDDLRLAHARALALDLASGWGLYADPTLARAPEGQAAGGRPQFAQGVHEVRIGLWSHPWRGNYFAFFGMLPAFCSIGNIMGLPWMVAGIALLLASFVGGTLLVVPWPRWIELELHAERLVVRQGKLSPREQSISLSQLATPRIVSNGMNQPCLLLRSHDGFQVEIVDRPRQELEWIVAWIEHARGQMQAALPEPVPEPPEELAALRARVRQPIPQ